MKFTTIERPNCGSSTKIEKNQISQIPYQIGEKVIEKPVSNQYIIEYKEKYLKQLSNLNSISQIWPKWNESIKNFINEDSWGDDVFKLGDNLCDVFSVTKGRSQKMVGKAGVRWEGLLVIYLNLIFWDTDIIAVRKTKENVPECILDCLTETIGNYQSTSELDVLVFSIPESEKLKGSTLKKLDEHLRPRIGQVNLVVLQCKTNWEESVISAVYYDNLYNDKIKDNGVSVGIKGLNPQSFKKFKYGFVTVPTGKRKIQSHYRKVIRVQNLSGGNYWGKPSKNNVASSFKEFAVKHFPDAFSSGIPNHLNKLRTRNRLLTEKFLNLQF